MGAGGCPVRLARRVRPTDGPTLMPACVLVTRLSREDPYEADDRLRKLTVVVCSGRHVDSKTVGLIDVVADRLLKISWHRREIGLPCESSTRLLGERIGDSLIIRRRPPKTATKWRRFVSEVEALCELSGNRERDWIVSLSLRYYLEQSIATTALRSLCKQRIKVSLSPAVRDDSSFLSRSSAILMI